MNLNLKLTVNIVTKDIELNDVSLIIATYNEEESLGYVLDEIKDLNIGETIVIDKSSTDNTKNIAENYDVKFITQTREGWGGAVKEAIELSSKEYITYMDGDGSYNPKALQEMKRVCKNDGDIYIVNHFSSETDNTFVKFFEKGLMPISKLLGWKPYFPFSEFNDYANLDVLEMTKVNIFDYWDIIHATNNK